MKASILGLVAFAAVQVAAAQESPLSLCTTLSFAPLDTNVPACTALIGNPRGLDSATLGQVHAARAEAYQFAITYHGEHRVRPDELLASALADLNQAVSAVPADAGEVRTRILQSRGELREQLGDRAGAIEDYRAVLAADSSYRYARQGLERLGAGAQ